LVLEELLLGAFFAQQILKNTSGSRAFLASTLYSQTWKNDRRQRFKVLGFATILRA